MKSKNIKWLLLGLLGSPGAGAQNMISMTSVHPVADTAGGDKQELAIRYPGLRQFNIVTHVYGYGDFDAKMNGRNFATGKLRTLRTSAFFNTPAIQWGRSSLSATLFYTYTSIRLKDIGTHQPEPGIKPLTADNSTIDLALNYSRSDRIFNHTLISSFIASFISGDLSSVRRFNFNGSLSLPLIRRENTSFSVGALVLIDPSAPSPVLPVISYYHRFTPSAIELIVDLPTGINLKRQLVKHTWISVGANQNSYSTFYDSHQGLLDGKASYNTIEVRSGLLLEYLFARKLILGLGGGINHTVSSRLFRAEENYKSAAVTGTNGSVPYASLSLSLLPF